MAGAVAGGCVECLRARARLQDAAIAAGGRFREHHRRSAGAAARVLAAFRRSDPQRAGRRRDQGQSRHPDRGGQFAAGARRAARRRRASLSAGRHQRQRFAPDHSADVGAGIQPRGAHRERVRYVDRCELGAEPVRALHPGIRIGRRLRVGRGGRCGRRPGQRNGRGGAQLLPVARPAAAPADRARVAAESASEPGSGAGAAGRGARHRAGHDARPVPGREHAGGGPGAGGRHRAVALPAGGADRAGAHRAGRAIGRAPAIARTEAGQRDRQPVHSAEATARHPGRRAPARRGHGRHRRLQGGPFPQRLDHRIAGLECLAPRRPEKRPGLLLQPRWVDRLDAARLRADPLPYPAERGEDRCGAGAVRKNGVDGAGGDRRRTDQLQPQPAARREPVQGGARLGAGRQAGAHAL